MRSSSRRRAPVRSGSRSRASVVEQPAAFVAAQILGDPRHLVGAQRVGDQIGGDPLAPRALGLGGRSAANCARDRVAPRSGSPVLAVVAGRRRGEQLILRCCGSDRRRCRHRRRASRRGSSAGGRDRARPDRARRLRGERRQRQQRRRSAKRRDVDHVESSLSAWRARRAPRRRRRYDTRRTARSRGARRCR